MSATAKAEQTRPVQTMQPVERLPLQRKPIPDSLEGVIPGENRAERYRNFVRGTLGVIWPTTGGGEYNDDLHRPARFDQRFVEGADPAVWMSGYTQFSPDGRDMANLSEDQFETVVQKLGTADYVRVRSVPPELMQPETDPMPVGGSCVIETWGERTMKEERAGVQAGVLPADVLPNTARKLVSLAPTITHLSGGLLGGYDQGVHLIEDDMWSERIWKEYGVPQEEAVQMTKDAYVRIHQALERRSKLINPDSVLVNVNFDELGLPGAIQSWMESMGMPYRPDFRVAEVIYTYAGPQQHELVKQALERQLQADGKPGPVHRAMEMLVQTTHHLRTKQQDHLRWGSMALPKELIMGMREPTAEEQEKIANDPAFATGLSIMQDVYRRQMTSRPTAIAAGFADLPTYGNGVQHETRLNFKGRADVPEDAETFLASVESQFTDPARLHSQNVPQHLDYLKRYTVDMSTAKKNLSAEMVQLQTELGPVKKAVSAREKAQTAYDQNELAVAANEAMAAFYRRMQNNEVTAVTPQEQAFAKKMADTAQRALDGVNRRRGTPEANQYDENDAVRLPQVIEAARALAEGTVVPVSHDAATYVGESVDRLVKVNAESRATRLQQLQTADAALSQARGAVPNCDVKETRVDAIKAEIASMAAPSYFPLSENPFVHHAMQFLWDPDFAIFMRDAVRVHEFRTADPKNKEESNRRMRELMGQIYPKLEAYVNYLFGLSDYPAEMRYTQLLPNAQ